MFLLDVNSLIPAVYFYSYDFSYVSSWSCIILILSFVRKKRACRWKSEWHTYCFFSKRHGIFLLLIFKILRYKINLIASCVEILKNICLHDAWRNVGPLQTEHTCSRICHKAVMGLWGSANSVFLYYEHLSVAWALVVDTGTVLFGDPAMWGLSLCLSLVKCFLTLAAAF